jgi:PIN domain nuclease of toxin-antitoxin system
LLLDTHIWVWSLTKPESLRPVVSQALAAEGNELWLSPVSIWEFLLLAERRRVDVEHGRSASEWVSRAFERAALRDAPVSREVALRSREVILEHEDPADRLLAATASVYELTLVTADERLLRGSGFQTLANR